MEQLQDLLGQIFLEEGTDTFAHRCDAGFRPEKAPAAKHRLAKISPVIPSLSCLDDCKRRFLFLI